MTKTRGLTQAISVSLDVSMTHPHKPSTAVRIDTYSQSETRDVEHQFAQREAPARPRLGRHTPA